MRYQNLAEWLEWQESLHPKSIELGLDRVRQVFQRLHPEPPPFTVITISGTNGKGSSAALLESIFLSAGYRTGSYSSPHLLRYNERIRIRGEEADDGKICAAFQRIDEARGDISLTYFEFGTLAALDLFYRTPLDVVLLEVGLGGRLDAVNIIDSDVALITSIGIDHTDWLGDDRSDIAREKAGIMRANRPAVCSDGDIPMAVYDEANHLGSQLYCLGRDFNYAQNDDHWFWMGRDGQQQAFPFPALSGQHQLQNASGVLMVVECLSESLPVSDESIQQALKNLHVTGRQQMLASKPGWIFDVAHNAQSAEALAELLKTGKKQTRTHAIVGMLQDKDISATLSPMLPYVSDWHCVDLAVPRAAKARHLHDVLANLSPGVNVTVYEGVTEAMAQLEKRPDKKELVVVFGSFYTVAEALQRGV